MTKETQGMGRNEWVREREEVCVCVFVDNNIWPRHGYGSSQSILFWIRTLQMSTLSLSLSPFYLPVCMCIRHFVELLKFSYPKCIEYMRDRVFLLLLKSAVRAVHKISSIKMQNNLLTRINTYRASVPCAMHMHMYMYTCTALECISEDGNFVYFLLDLNNNNNTATQTQTHSHAQVLHSIYRHKQWAANMPFYWASVICVEINIIYI